MGLPLQLVRAGPPANNPQPTARDSDDQRRTETAKAKQAAFAEAVAKANDRSRTQDLNVPPAGPAPKPLDQTAELLGLQLPSMDRTERTQGAASTRQPESPLLQQRMASAARNVAALPLALWQSLDAVFPASMRPTAGVLHHTLRAAQRGLASSC